MAKTSQQMLDRMFALIEHTALRNERCPQLQPYGILTTAENIAILDLARAGKLRVEVFVHNWRVVTICEGPNRGKHTLRSPNKNAGPPHRVIQKGDVPAGQRQMPSAPRLLKYAGQE